MNDFDLSIQEGKLMAGGTDIPMLIVGEQRDLLLLLGRAAGCLHID